MSVPSFDTRETRVENMTKPLPPGHAGERSRPEPLRILYLLDVLSVFGGTEKQLRELVAHMDRSRFTPTLATLYTSHEPHDAEFNRIGYPVRSLGVRRMLSLRALRTVLRLAAEIRRQRIGVVHTFFPDASILGTIAGKLGGARVVIGRRDLGFWYTPRYLTVLRWLQRFVDAYLVNSQAVRAVISESERVDPARVQVVYNGFFDAPSGPSRLSLADLGFPPDAKLVGLVANLSEVKRLDRFVDMAAGIRDPKACFLIVGYGKLRETLLEQARRLGLAGRFRVTHTIHDVMEMVKLFQVGVLTSDSEGLSNTLVEYGLAGVPAVAFDVGGNCEVIESGNSGYLVEPYDVQALGHCVDGLLADEGLRNRMGASARALCADRFSGPRMIAETQRIYDALVGREP